MSNQTLGFSTFSVKELYEASLIGAHPNIDKLMLMQSPLPVISILVAYLLFVKKIGPMIMENRKPFELRKVMIAYNALQVIWCLHIVRKMFLVENSIPLIFSFGCKVEVIASDVHLGKVVVDGTHAYFIAKLLDLFDTVFFVLRKKDNQVSFLHLYHHSVMFVGTWYYFKYMLLDMESGIFIGLINSLVHTFMYTYYGLSALGPSVRKYLWWKKYITWLQLIQFGSMLSYIVYMICFSCRVDNSFIYFFLANVCFFIYLFLDFYHNTYVVKPKSRKVE